jgi:general secretion pathway protein K
LNPSTKACLPRKAGHQAGAALLAAMLTVTLVATLAASALSQQWRDVEIETSERARVQAGWMLGGALDWSRLILREDFRATTAGGGTQIDSLNEPWAVPLQEARLSSFLAADPNNTGEAGADELFLSGAIIDAQGLFNLRNLVAENQAVDTTALQMLERLCAALDLPEQEASVIARGLVAAQLGDTQDAALMPQRLDEIAWLGVSARTIQRLAPYATVLPERSAVNLNTASALVLAAVLDISSSVAQKMTVARSRQPFRALSDARQAAGVEWVTDDSRHSVTSRFFHVRGQLRLAQAGVEEKSLLKRDRDAVRIVWRERGAVGPPRQASAAP